MKPSLNLPNTKYVHPSPKQKEQLFNTTQTPTEKIAREDIPRKRGKKIKTPKLLHFPHALPQFFQEKSTLHNAATYVPTYVFEVGRLESAKNKKHGEAKLATNGLIQDTFKIRHIHPRSTPTCSVL